MVRLRPLRSLRQSRGWRTPMDPARIQHSTCARTPLDQEARWRRCASLRLDLRRGRYLAGSISGTLGDVGVGLGRRAETVARSATCGYQLLGLCMFTGSQRTKGTYTHTWSSADATPARASRPPSGSCPVRRRPDLPHPGTATRSSSSSREATCGRAHVSGIVSSPTPTQLPHAPPRTPLADMREVFLAS